MYLADRNNRLYNVFNLLKQLLHMKNFIPKEIASDLVKLGVYQVTGCIIGAGVIGWNLYNDQVLTPVTLSLYGGIFLIFGYSAFCGILCLKNKRNALLYSLINQMLQLLGFAILGYAFRYVSGFYLSIGLDFSDSFEFDFGVGISSFTLNINKDPQLFKIDINLVASGLVFWIDRLMRIMNHYTDLKEIRTIGE
jgi:hypothetical protein